MTTLPKTLNRPQVIALYALAMQLGPQTEFTILTVYTIGDVLVEARFKTIGGDSHPIEVTDQYTLPTHGGSQKIEQPKPKEATPA